MMVLTFCFQLPLLAAWTLGMLFALKDGIDNAKGDQEKVLARLEEA